MFERDMNKRQKSWMLMRQETQMREKRAVVTRAKKMGEKEGGKHKESREGRKGRRGREDKDVNHNM